MKTNVMPVAAKKDDFCLILNNKTFLGDSLRAKVYAFSKLILANSFKNFDSANVMLDA